MIKNTNSTNKLLMSKATLRFLAGL